MKLNLIVGFTLNQRGQKIDILIDLMLYIHGQHQLVGTVIYLRHTFPRQAFHPGAGYQYLVHTSSPLTYFNQCKKKGHRNIFMAKFS